MESHPLRFLRSLGRSREIATVLLNHGFGDMVERLHLRRYLQWGRRVLFRQRPQPEKHYTRAQRVRMALESLGAAFIKFGQVVSTRPDLLPADIVEELSRLQEQVPAFPSEQAVALVEAELGSPINVLFAEFDREPLAAGSLAQVHIARHHDGTALAIKIRRPNVVREVERDLDLMFELAILAERHMPEAEIFEPVGLVNHFARTIRRELNFEREGRTVDEFRRMFRNDATLYVPRVYADLTTEAVLTMEFIEGCRVDETERLKQTGVQQKEVAANGARIFMKQALELGVFHGDPHPGNVRILEDGSLCLLDYGMVGLLDDDSREKLVDLFLAITHRDVNLAVELVQRIGRPRRDVDIPLLRADVRDFVDNYYETSLEHLSIGRMLSDFVAILSNHTIHCPADLMLLIRALITLEGVGRKLDPQFNMAGQLAPFVAQVVRDRYNPRRIANRLISESKVFAQLAHDVPLHLGKTLEKLSTDDLRVQLEHRGLDHVITELDRSSNRVVIALVMSSLIIASALIIRSDADALWLSVPVFVLSSFLGIWLIYGVLRSGRL